MPAAVCPMTKSPLALAKVAYDIARKSLSPYSSKFSRRDFTQPQLFALLTLRTFLGVDLRGLIAFLNDWSDLREALELKKIPHYSTLSYAQKRLLKKVPFELFSETSSAALTG